MSDEAKSTKFCRNPPNTQMLRRAIYSQNWRWFIVLRSAQHPQIPRFLQIIRGIWPMPLSLLNQNVRGLSTHYPLYDFDLRATHARTLLPAALASVSFGFVLVRVPESFRTCFVCATHAHFHFCPQHWLLCHLGLYLFEFDFGGGRRHKRHRTKDR
jgi:hypothetical protein